MSNTLKVGDAVRMDYEDSLFRGEIGVIQEVRGDSYRVMFGNVGRQSWADRDSVDQVDLVAPYRDAIFAVDPGACNLQGLVRSLARHMDLIRYEAGQKGQGTDYVNRHPAVVLFLSQMVYLATGDQLDTDKYLAALDACKAKVAEAEQGKAVVDA